MANIRTGSIVSDIRGKVGSEIYSRNRGGAYVKAYAAPVQPGNANQIAAQTNLSDAVAAWAALPESDRIKWDWLADQIKSKGVFEKKNSGGRSLFLSRYMNIASLGITPSNLSPVIDVNTPVVSAEVIPGTTKSRMVMLVNSSFSTSDYALGWYSSVSVPLTVRSINSVFTAFYQVQHPVQNGQVNAGINWGQRFGALINNQYVYWRLVLVSLTSGRVHSTYTGRVIPTPV